MNFHQDKKFMPPPNYVAGLGRGALGFMTRSDIGPARLNPEPPSYVGANPMNYVAGVGRGAIPFNKEEMEGDNEVGDYSDAKYDEWSGYGGSLFSHGDYDDEDKEADEIYSMVDRHMDSRRRIRREKKLKDELKKLRAERPSIAQQFSDLKRNLSGMNYDDWMSIPEIGDYTVKKVKRDKYIPVPDSILETARKEGEKNNSISISDFEGTQTSLMNINEIGEARGTVLSLKLDKISDSVVGKTNVDTKGYLTDLNSLPINTDADIGDFKKARLLLKSVINSNPKNVSGWIAAARVEELDGKLQTARNILAQGLQNCLDNEDLWLEAARLEIPDKARAVLAKAISTLPKSVKIWIAAANKENDKAMKSKVLRRALENVPNSVKLWKELIELEGEGGAKVLLHRAVECVPHCLEMWLALAKLETYEIGRMVLNKARQSLPLEHSIWINAAKLEESGGKEIGVIENVIGRGIKILQKNGMKIKRDDWLNEAILAEKSENPLTCKAIIKTTISVDIDEDDLERVLLEDAEVCENKGNIITARSIYNYLLENIPAKKIVWVKVLEFERRYCQIDNGVELDNLLERAIKECPNEALFWLMIAKRKWQNSSVEEAKNLLKEANLKLENNEEIFLAQAKLEREVNEIESARNYLELARSRCHSAKVWLRSIKLEVQEKNFEAAIKFCEEAITKFPLIDRVWTISADLRIKINEIDKARNYFERGIEIIPTSSKLWTNFIELEINEKNFAKGRALLEKAKTKLKSTELLYTGIKLEQKANNKNGALFMLAKALQENPTSGELWSIAIELESKSTRKAKIVDALKQCDNDPLVIVSVAKLFWKDKKYEKAKKWFERGIALDPNNGDIWAFYWRFLFECEGKESAEEIKKKCIEQDPRGGKLWNMVKKGDDGWKFKTFQLLEKVGILAEELLKKIE